MRPVRISVFGGARIRRILTNPRYVFVLGLGRSKGGVVAKCQKSKIFDFFGSGQNRLEMYKNDVLGA